MPAFRQGSRKEGSTELIRRFFRTKEGHILLTKRQMDRSQNIESGKLTTIGLKQANMRHRFGNPLWLALDGPFLALFHADPLSKGESKSWLSCSIPILLVPKLLARPADVVAGTLCVPAR